MAGQKFASHLEALGTVTTTAQGDGGDTTPPPTPSPIYPGAGQVVESAGITLRWGPVKDPSGVTYRVEVESFSENAGAYVSTVFADDIAGSELPHRMRSTRERWRVTAVDGAGNESAPSAWAKYARSTVTVPVTRPTTLTTLPTPTLTLITLRTTTTIILY